jgi:hypothetical protein
MCIATVNKIELVFNFFSSNSIFDLSFFAKIFYDILLQEIEVGLHRCLSQ